MNVEKDIQEDGIIVTEKIDTKIVLEITKNISTKIAQTFPNFGLDEEEIFAKLFTLNMYKADMPEGMAEANYCYRNSSIYFNSHIADEDLEEFAIHECLHFLQERKNNRNQIKKMGLSKYSKFKVIGTGLNEAAVQYLSSKLIGITPDFEKYYDINLYTPSPAYYPLECSLLNQIIYFIGEDVLFRSTYFSTDELQYEITKRTSKKTFKNILISFDKILKYEEQILLLKNHANDDSDLTEDDIQNRIENLRENIKQTFIQTQNLIIKEFFNSEYKQITNLELLEVFRKKLLQFENIIGTTDNYTFFSDFCLDMMNKLEHKSSILKNGGMETAIAAKSFSLSVSDFFGKLRDLLFYKKVN